MSKSMNMLRTRRKDNNVKPNRRLDRKSSRGMIYENEELRLKTININAEVERGQSDLKKLRRENEMLKKEIWSLRDEYEKLDKLLHEKAVDFSSSSTLSSDSESCSSCTEESLDVEKSQNRQNVQKTNLKNLHLEFDHLSVVPEENSTDNSESAMNTNSKQPSYDFEIKPDQGYPEFPPRVHFYQPEQPTYREPVQQTFQSPNPLVKSSSDLIVKLDNTNFTNSGSFSNGGNLEELLNDLETISQDILKISNEQAPPQQEPETHKTELNVVLMPTPMPLLGFEKYQNLKASCESINRTLPEPLPQILLPAPVTPVTPDEEFMNRYNPDQFLKPEVKKVEADMCSSRSNLLELTSSDHISSENEENLKLKLCNGGAETTEKKQKMSIRRKVSIHFKGKKDKKKAEEIKKDEAKIKKTPSIESKKSSDVTATEVNSKKHASLELKSSGSDRNSQTDKKHNRKSTSESPDRKQQQTDKKQQQQQQHKKNRKLEKLRVRRSTTSTERVHNHRERSFSVCTDRSGNFLEPRPLGLDEIFASDRERSNSASSCGSGRIRKMSNMSFPVGGKIPWCGCWGNGCV